MVELEVRVRRLTRSLFTGRQDGHEGGRSVWGNGELRLQDSLVQSRSSSL